jgi:hypothetical protein
MPTLDDLIGYEPPADLEGVTQDSSSKVYLPTTTAEHQTLLGGSGLNAPSSFWIASQATTTLADLGTGGRNVTIAGSPTLGAAAPGWTATGIKCTDGSATQNGQFTISDVSTTSGLLLQMWGVNSNPAAARDLNYIGSASAHHAVLIPGTSGPKVRGETAAGTADGDVNYSAILLTLTKFDRSRSEVAVYTRGEQLKPTWSAPVASTTAYLFGGSQGAPDATLVYAAYWSGADAEISDAQAQKLLDYYYGDSTTLSRMQAGSFAAKLVVAIEGCRYLLCESHTTAALRAWAGTDWTEALTGLFVELKNNHTLQPWQPFTGGGSCSIRVIDTDNSDTFGILVNQRLSGAESELTETIDRNDTTIPIASSQDFTSSGTAYIGTEAVGYTGTTATSLTGVTRGKWSPFGCAPSGSGGRRFANHHRVGPDSYQVLTKPIVSQLPRVWLGKRVGVWLHAWDEATQTMNSRDEAQLLYAGRIAAIADDPNDGATVIDVAPVHEEIANGVIGRDFLSATIAEGLSLIEGRVFNFKDWKYTGSVQTANALTVVAAGAASGTNQMDAGRYTLGELCEKLNAWLAGEKAAGRIYGFYNWKSPVTSNVGLRTKCYWRITDGSSVPCSFGVDMPGEVMGFLGLTDSEPTDSGQTEQFAHVKHTNTTWIAQGKSAPFTNLVFKPTGPGRLSQGLQQGFGEPITYTLDDVRGTFVDQYSALPSVIKGACIASYPWGVFLLNESTLIVGSYEDGVISNCWIAPFQATGDKDKQASTYIGRRVDEPEGGEITIRQIFILESSLSTLLSTMVYGTGTAGYNHADFDALGYGFGLGIPGELLGGSFDNSLTNLPQSNSPVAVVIDEPTKFSELFSADLVVRRGFLRWKDESFEFAQWKTPMTAISVAALTESNKAAPAGHTENHRIATVETSEHARPVIKIDYCRDFAIGRDGQYLKSLQLEDTTAVDDAGGDVKAFTIKLRNAYHDLQGAGAAVEGLAPEFLAFMPAVARPTRILTRSVDMRFFEGLGVGDIVTVTDTFARDPLTGVRGIGARPAIITRISYDLGGPSTNGTVRPMGGDVELMFLDLHRGELYAPAAQVDDTATNAGYNAGTKVLTCYEHKYSHSVTVTLNWGRISRTFHVNEDADATWFEIGDKVNVIEMDPSNPASPQNWPDTVAAQSGNTITLTTGLAGWDTTKKYRVVPQKYSQVQATQQDYAYQADSTDRMVEDTVPFFNYAGANGDTTYVANSGDEPAELIPTLAYGDGRPQDPGYDRALVHSLNRAIDFKTAHQMPFMYGRTVASSSSNWVTVFAGPVFLGFDTLSGVLTRSLTIAPLFENGSGNPATTVSLRATLARMKPSEQTAVSAWSGTIAYINPVFANESSQTTAWTTTSLTPEMGEEKTLNIAVKDLTWGFAWLVIESKDGAAFYGLSKCIEGARTLTAAGNALLQGVSSP